MQAASSRRLEAERRIWSFRRRGAFRAQNKGAFAGGGVLSRPSPRPTGHYPSFADFRVPKILSKDVFLLFDRQDSLFSKP